MVDVRLFVCGNGGVLDARYRYLQSRAEDVCRYGVINDAV